MSISALNKRAFGYFFMLIGFLLIILRIALSAVFLINMYYVVPIPPDKAIDGDTLLYMALSILLSSIGLIGLVIVDKKIRKPSSKPRSQIHIGNLFFAIFSFGSIGSLIVGGGFYVGSIVATVGAWLFIYSMHSWVSGNEARSLNMQDLSLKRKTAGILTLLVFSFALGPFAFQVYSIPAPLFPTYSSPPSDITPNHSNIFWILPIWEWQGDNYTYGIEQLNYLKRTLCGEDYNNDEFIRVGRSVSCWYTNTIYPNGSYDPTILIHTLNLSTITNTPILFHMNGGNWGQGCSEHPIIEAMRQNVSNCQWDQKNVCHPIKCNPGPNDRFWSFAPNTDWEMFRERNIKQALAVIYDWWQNNPDLLVGFSTDSEIHLNYNKFKHINEGNYSSYFDYNPLVIEQYRFWAQSNWSLVEFNKICGTNFQTWAEVDAPRADNVVGVKGNPWWETWTDFRIWHVKEAAARQSKWINESGFPRWMIWNHQILSEPNSESARYQRADPIETAINDYCKLGVTRYGWLSPQVWYDLGVRALNDGSGDKYPSWGIFEWNLWTQHDYWAYRETLNAIYQYGGHVICPNEWANCSINEGLWIPGDPCQKGDVYKINNTEYGSPETGCIGTPGNCCCVVHNGTDCLRCVDPHGNPQFIKALQDFIAIGKDFPRGTCAELRINNLRMLLFEQYNNPYGNVSEGLFLISMGSAWILGIFYVIVLYFVGKRKYPRNT